MSELLMKAVSAQELLDQLRASAQECKVDANERVTLPIKIRKETNTNAYEVWRMGHLIILEPKEKEDKQIAG